ncbi:MAG: class I SAM-dependent methyltransferase [Bacteroidota bacterium]|nr:class I SAM-dependent methyltransferase [Bacteroidota bacterium]
MAHLLFRLKSYLSYWLEAVDEHSLHSPFFFDLYTTQIKSPPTQKRFVEIESLRRKLLNDHRMIAVRDLGSGGQQNPDKRISDIARTSLSSSKYSAVFSALTTYFDSSLIIELGTSFGINTLYLAAKPDAVVTTFEGAPAVADIAALTFEFASASNIKLVVGNIDRTLPSFLQGVRRVDFAFVDANHRYEPTLQYCEWLMKKVHEKSVIVLDDIHHSPEMDKAWRTLKAHRLVYASADLFRCGILFFDPSLNKQHVILQV